MACSTARPQQNPPSSPPLPSPFLPFPSLRGGLVAALLACHAAFRFRFNRTDRSFPCFSFALSLSLSLSFLTRLPGTTRSVSTATTMARTPGGTRRGVTSHRSFGRAARVWVARSAVPFTCANTRQRATTWANLRKTYCHPHRQETYEEVGGRACMHAGVGMGGRRTGRGHILRHFVGCAHPPPESLLLD